MDTLRISISEIHPGDLPKKSSWERYRAYPNERFLQEYAYTPFGICLLQGVGLLLMDGNHRVARLYEAGVEEILYFQRSLTHKDEGFWSSRIDQLHKKGINNFGDFLKQCQSGRFYR